jgi:GntR family transcriptional repressor for pyruvate dehydrogenase complex/GntR family uxuAB operon transcriptional repressor
VQIANQILERIRSGELARGAQLPPEREFAAQMGVSRPTVREALIALELLRVVEIRIGQGTYVIGDIQTSLEDVVLPGVKAPFDLLEARSVIESNTAAHCAEHWANGVHREEQWKNVVAISQAMMKIVHDDGQIDTFFHLGLAFHKALAACSTNEVLAQIICQLVDATNHPLWELINRKILEDQQTRQCQIDEHEHIVRAIQQGDDQEAARAMRQHLLHLLDFSLS